ncbi:DUF1361 domain-containing protein [Chitinophaga sp. YIM B06452]|uniref:DUF1361 domain-containing protein n=1 Tax=Chitinophaga sp. YIM B06452 TaxID=3082158 RepID=UPI0031FE922B
MKPVEKMILLSILFMCLLLAVRICYTQNIAYIFLAWNTVLALIPLAISRKLKPGEAPGPRNILQLSAWLLFFPNAPYLLTDLFHFHAKPPVPAWFDLFLLVTAAWNGLLLGMVSLMQVEHFLMAGFKKSTVHLCLAGASLLCGYGIYIGRFMRFNSWDVIAAPHDLLQGLAAHFIHPFRNAEVWFFTALFAAMFSLFYFTLKKLRSHTLC